MLDEAPLTDVSPSTPGSPADWRQRTGASGMIVAAATKTHDRAIPYACDFLIRSMSGRIQPYDRPEIPSLERTARGGSTP